MEKRFTIFTIAGSILFAAVLLALGVIIGRSLNQPKTVVLNSNSEQSNSTNLSQEENTITVVGKSTLNVKAEVAQIYIGIEICDSDAQKANEKVNDLLASVTSGLKRIGLNKSEITPSNFTLYPEYDSFKEFLTGFCATNRIDIETSKVNQVSKILDKAIESGATNIYGVDFTAKDLKKLSEEGIQAAYQDAERQAQTLAEMMNVSIEEIVTSNIEMGDYLRNNYTGYYGGGGGVSPQDGTLSVNVTVVYRVSK